MAAGQEILVRYGDAKWFGVRKIPYADVDYSSLIWRPDLHPLPCRQSVRPTIGADGRHSFFVLADTIPSGTVVEISVCLEVSVIVVDQFPVLWDFVIMDAITQQVCARTRMQKSVGNQYTHMNTYPCVKIPQACVPLSYAALIPTTPNPDLANVRVSLSNVNQYVRQCNVRYLVSIRVSRRVSESSVCCFSAWMCACVRDWCGVVACFCVCV